MPRAKKNSELLLQGASCNKFKVFFSEPCGHKKILTNSRSEAVNFYKLNIYILILRIVIVINPVDCIICSLNNAEGPVLTIATEGC